MCTGNLAPAASFGASTSAKAAAGAAAHAAVGNSRPMTFDPDLEQRYKTTHRGQGSRAPLVNYDERERIVAEQTRRNDLNAQNAAIAAQRTAAIAQQQQQLQDMQKQQADLVVAQGKEAADLQAQQAARVAGIQTAGSAVTQSLQILGKQQTKQGPTASVAKKPGTQVAGKRTAARSLQIGSTSSTPGAGANLSV